MQISHLDHLVLTVRDLEITINFYERILGMTAITFGQGRRALKFGNQKINLHLSGHEIDPCAAAPTPGSADLCFITTTPLSEVIAHLEENSIPIIEANVERTGATGKLRSVYFRDPDYNLIELSNRMD